MKRIFIAIMLFTLCLSLCACGRRNDADMTTTTAATTERTTIPHMDPTILDPTIMDPTIATNIPDPSVDTSMPDMTFTTESHATKKAGA